MNNVEIDSHQVDNLLSKLNPEDNKKVLTESLRMGGKALKQETLSNIAKSNFRSNTPNRWNGKTMESGVRMKVDKAYSEVMVNIMGDFRLKFFEKGTKERTTRTKNTSSYSSTHKLKRSNSRGSIKAYHFFRAARDNEQKITDSVFESLDKSFSKLDMG